MDKILLNVESWLTARNAVLLSTLTPGSNSGPFGGEVKRMLSVYDRLTDFRSPTKWVDELTRVRLRVPCFSFH